MFSPIEYSEAKAVPDYPVVHDERPDRRRMEAIADWELECELRDLAAGVA